MLLRDFLNEFELDWAQAAVRSGQIPQCSLKGARILLAGDQMELQEAIAWSFMAWNDEKHSDVKVAEAAIQADGTLAVTHSFTAEPVTGVTADYVILTGLCCAQVPQTPPEQLEYLQTFGALADAVCRLNCKRILLLSDGRYMGRFRRSLPRQNTKPGRQMSQQNHFQSSICCRRWRVCLYQRRGQRGRTAVFCVPDECMAHAFRSKNTRRLRWQNIRQWKRSSH